MIMGQEILWSQTPNTWSYDIYVPGSGTYYLNNTLKSQGTTYTINAGNITQSCLNIKLEDKNTSCIKDVVICPPKPCSTANCQLEVYQEGALDCDGIFYVQLQISNPNGLSLCYRKSGAAVGSPVPLSGIIGPFTGSEQVIIYNCNNASCFKMIWIAKPDCEELGNQVLNGRIEKQQNSLLRVVPNPFRSDVITIYSYQESTSYKIFDLNGRSISEGTFTGSIFNLEFPGSRGVYILSYLDSDGHVQYLKLVKQ